MEQTPRTFWQNIFSKFITIPYNMSVFIILGGILSQLFLIYWWVEWILERVYTLPKPSPLSLVDMIRKSNIRIPFQVLFHKTLSTFNLLYVLGTFSVHWTNWIELYIFYTYMRKNICAVTMYLISHGTWIFSFN